MKIFGLRRKRSVKYTLVILFIIVVTGSPFVLWILQPFHHLDIVVIDKTIPALDWREHKSFFWILEHLKFVHPSTEAYYRYKTDYYGYDPVKKKGSVVSDLDISGANLLYITDTYGVYKESEDVHGEGNKTIDDSLIYGGLSRFEADKIVKFCQRGGFLISEFNTLEFPTSHDSVAVKMMSILHGIEYTGVIGRSYDDLKNVSWWIKERYSKITGKEWDFSGHGIIIASEPSQGDPQHDVFVVLLKDDLNDNYLHLTRSSAVSMVGVEDNVPYFYWFEYIRPLAGAQVLAKFELSCNESGRQKLASAGLSTTFPAVVASDSTLHRYYFAGDFADNNVEQIWTYVYAIEYPLKYLYYFYFVQDQTRFFWRFYLPLMMNILFNTEHHKTLMHP